MESKNKIDTLRKIMRIIEFPTEKNEMYSSSWFLQSLLSKANNDFKIATEKLKNLSHKLLYVSELRNLNRINEGKNLNY